MTNKSTWDTPLHFALVAFFFYYLPLFNPATAVVTVHDNLDADVVINHIVADWFQGRTHASLLALNGNIPIWALTRFSQPLTAFYLLDNPWLAYLLNDITVRATAFAGALLLGMRFKAEPWLAATGAACFAFSITYTVFGLTVAGLPAILWLATTPPHTSKLSKYLMLGTAVIIGWNSSLFLSGGFFLVAMIPLLRFGFGAKIDRWVYWCVTAYAIGLALGNWNIVFAQWFSGIIWHRVEYGLLIDSSASNLRSFFTNLLSLVSGWQGYPWYHVSMPLIFLLFSGVLVAISQKDARRNALVLCGMLLFVAMFYSTLHTQIIANFRQEIGGVFASFQIDRFYFLSSLLVLCVWILASRSAARTNRILLASAFLQLTIVISHTPHWKQAFIFAKRGDPDVSASSFASYYKWEWFEAARIHLERGAVISVGLDPMIAPMNGIPSLDGYYVMYPLAYKHRFRAIINDSIKESGKMNYFDRWGNRVYTFHSEKHPEQIDYCSAYVLGARHVISSESIETNTLRRVAADFLSEPYLYEIVCNTDTPSLGPLPRNQIPESVPTAPGSAHNTLIK